MPANTSLPSGFNCAAIRRRSATSSVEIKFAQITSYRRAGLSGNIATFVTSSLAAGTHAITATYSGDATYSGSTTSINVTVNAAPPATSATPAPALSSWSLLLLGLGMTIMVSRMGRHVRNED